MSANGPAPSITAAKPCFDDDDVAAIVAATQEVLRSGRLILGPRLAALETEFAARVGVKHAIGVASCGAALEITYKHLGVAGREVIVPTNTFAATAAAVIAAGGKPVFADMNADDFCIDADDAIKRITDRTAAVVVVHISGFIAASLPKLQQECERRGIPLIEDCAHAHGAGVEGKIAGSNGLAGCFSFYPSKILTCGVGGMLTTNDDTLAAFARSMRHHGQGKSIEEIVHPGADLVLDEIRASIAHAQLRRLDDFIERRRRAARRYADLLANDERFTLPRPGPGAVYYKLPVILARGIDRDAVRRRMLEKHGIEVGALYSPPCHLMPVFREKLGTGPGQLPVAEEILARQLTVPLHAGLQPGDVEKAVEALDESIRALGFIGASKAA